MKTDGEILMRTEKPMKYSIGRERKHTIDTIGTNRLIMCKDYRIQDLAILTSQNRQRYQLQEPTFSRHSHTVHRGTLHPKLAKGQLIYPTPEELPRTQGKRLTMILYREAGHRRWRTAGTILIIINRSHDGKGSPALECWSRRWGKCAVFARTFTLRHIRTIMREVPMYALIAMASTTVAADNDYNTTDFLHILKQT